ncbi:MAG TPA: T9SS type A sorting domain-containing protein [Candidatus Sulfotelmatobacter sp.]|nr:T9SS type A sorting domain-containing protein [Candidatus Sulfotelmatobacter sp.]
MAPTPRSPLRLVLPAITLALLAVPAGLSADPDRRAEPGPVAGTNVLASPLPVSGRAVVSLGDLAKAQARISILSRPPVRPLVHPELNEEEQEEETGPIAPAPKFSSVPRILLSSPPPTTSFQGLDDIPMVDSSYIIIPPDVNGAVGLSTIFQNLNNNVRVLNKADGSPILTVGVNTFWAPAGGAPNDYTDPRTVYDPYNNRWITIMQGDLSNATGNSLVIGLSDTSDPTGVWHLWRTILYESTSIALADFPTLGFNKNWITVSINMYRNTGNANGVSILMIHYPSLRSGTWDAFRVDRTGTSNFCYAPVQTYSATSDTEYVMQHLSASSATYRVDRITGTGPGAPTYTVGTTQTRTGGGWASGSGQSLPQSAPNAGSSACGSTPCRIELIDSQLRTAPVFRNGSIWYVQTIGLPAVGMTHSAAQWTQITTPSGAYVDGGRVEDPTATVSNGGKWYAYPQIAVNAQENFLVGFSQCSSAQHPSAGYAMHFASDGAGTIRDPVISRAGEDYYHKDFGTGRNRWGDFTSSQVDPADDATLWTVAEYAKNRPNTDDGTTGSNGSRWSTWWASVGTSSFTITASAGANGSIVPSGAVSVSQGADQSFTISPSPNFHVADVLVDGSSVGAVTGYTFNNVNADHTIAASFAPDSFTVTLSVVGPGSAARNPDQLHYAYNSNVQLTATPLSGCAFLGWSGDSLSALNPLTVPVLENLTLTATFADTTPPVAQVLAPLPSDDVTVGGNATLKWSATDNLAVTRIDLLLSRAGSGGPFDSVATGLANSGSFDWTVTGPPSLDAVLEVIARDSTGLVGTAISDSAFAIASGNTAVGQQVVREFALDRVSPQPVRGAAHIRFELPREASIRLTVLDVQGRVIEVLADGSAGAGVHEVAWAGTRLPSGLYFLRLKAPGHTFVQRVVRLQ